MEHKLCFCIESCFHGVWQNPRITISLVWLIPSSVQIWRCHLCLLRRINIHNARPSLLSIIPHQCTMGNQADTYLMCPHAFSSNSDGSGGLSWEYTRWCTCFQMSRSQSTCTQKPKTTTKLFILGPKLNVCLVPLSFPLCSDWHRGLIVRENGKTTSRIQ